MLPGALPYLNEGQGKGKESLAGGSEDRSSFIPNEERASLLFLKASQARGRRRLCRMQPARGLDEASRRNNHKERSGKLDVHVASSINNAGK
jgi:hypothetical protein